MSVGVDSGYRSDIDGLRTIAVLSVIIFHFGYLPYGYLGVDIFFVISGYLITKIIDRDIRNNRFSLRYFYLRRVRRILPLVLVVTIIAMVIGFFVMLPDDFENLVQSVVATNFFSNNILQYITTGNYWDVVNEYKPLMHTWSLGVEEQFYVLYPLIFLLLGKKEKLRKFVLPTIILFTLISIVLFISPVFGDASKFYLLPFRFFEIAIGGIGALLFKDKLIQHKLTPLSILLLLVLFIWDINWLNDNLRLILTVFLTLFLLLSANEENKVLSNRIMVGIGKISFSLYLWHQLVLAYARYTLIGEINISHIIIMLLIIFMLSIISYNYVEQPFRNKVKIKTPKLIWILSIGFAFTTVSSLAIYIQAGVVRDVPELEIVKYNVHRGIHAEYNDAIHERDREFSDTDNIKVFVVGNSFARDWVNVLLESKYKDSIEITYTTEITNDPLDIERLEEAEYIFFSELDKAKFDKYKAKYDIDESKVWNVGTKNFGKNNGIHYSKRKTEGYFDQRTIMEEGYLEKNQKLKSEWGDRYIDLISMVFYDDYKVPVFTPDGKFISQDCRHLTKAGAKFFGSLISQE
ncbi:acyltransferase family protein [Psychrobacillus sp. L4]|uniref:acyltransferase family protein n=1 Tax=Psychrobacillus sp. L4 TaxID=3236892 RepID=UPI0036F19CD2